MKTIYATLLGAMVILTASSPLLIAGYFYGTKGALVALFSIVAIMIFHAIGKTMIEAKIHDH